MSVIYELGFKSCFSQVTSVRRRIFYQSSNADEHARIEHTYVVAHSLAHAHIHTHTPTYIQTRITHRTHVLHTHTETHQHTRARAYTHTYTDTHTPVCAYANHYCLSSTLSRSSNSFEERSTRLKNDLRDVIEQRQGARRLALRQDIGSYHHRSGPFSFVHADITEHIHTEGN